MLFISRIDVKGGSLPKKPLPALTGRTVRCLLFDLGDTLWFRKDLAVWQQLEYASNVQAATLLRQAVAPISLPDKSDTALGQRLRDATDEQIRIMIRQNPGLEPDCAHAVVQVLQQWSIEGVTRDNGAAIFEALRVRIPKSRPLFDDVLSTLTTLQQRGFQLGIVTNRHWGGQPFQEDLHTLGLLNFFDPRHMAISADLGIRKPNPAIFLHALNALNIPPEEAVMVGDSLKADILGGKMLGIFTIWKPKPHVRRQANLIATGATTAAHSTLVLPEDHGGEQHDDLSEGLLITDDDYVLSYVLNREGRVDQHMQSDIKPDLIIENISDLLDIFTEVGVQ
ncbi:MAG: HAD family hydrolase [Chloroflexi bacterium]|nr:MAG: HAD family hydrolase [Chloroflexota bacterium]